MSQCLDAIEGTVAVEQEPSGADLGSEASERGCSLAARALALRFGQIVATVLAPLICSQAAAWRFAELVVKAAADNACRTAGLPQAGWRASFCLFGTASFLQSPQTVHNNGSICSKAGSFPQVRNALAWLCNDEARIQNRGPQNV